MSEQHPHRGITPDTVVIWMLQLEDPRVDRAAVLRTYGAFIADNERVRAAQFISEPAGVLYLFARVLLRVVLCQYLPAEHAPSTPASLVFNAGPHGKPSLAAPYDRSGLRFNLSHSGAGVVCAVAQDREVGVDIEPLARVFEFDDIVSHYFVPHEISAIQSAPLTLRRERFFYYWTLKEAYLKARGEGLSYPLSAVGFDLQPTGDIRLQDTHDSSASSRWACRSLEPLRGYRAGLCWERHHNRSDPHVELKTVNSAELNLLIDALNRTQV